MSPPPLLTALNYPCSPGRGRCVSEARISKGGEGGKEEHERSESVIISFAMESRGGPYLIPTDLPPPGTPS